MSVNRTKSSHPAANGNPSNALEKERKIRPSGYYAWTTQREPCAREVRRLQLIEAIRLVHERSNGTYGSPRVR